MKVTKYFYEDGQTLKVLIYNKVRKENGRLTSQFSIYNTVYDILIPNDLSVPAFITAQKIGEIQIQGKYSLRKLFRYTGITDHEQINGLKRVYGVVVRTTPEKIIKGKKTGNVWWYPKTFSVLTTDDKKYCIAPSFVDGITKFTFVEVIVDAEVEVNERRSLRGVITKKLPMDDAMDIIHDEFGSLDEFFRNINKKF
jgi:hypothetical protein